jgi:hypothetical protein
LLLVVNLGMAVAYLVGLGWLALALFPAGTRADSLLKRIALACTVGMILNYGLILAIGSIRWSLIAGCPLSLFGLAMLIRFVRRTPGIFTSPAKTMGTVLGLSAVLLVFFMNVFSDPEISWDGRFIWYMHAKMIHAYGAIGEAAGWNQPSLAFSHLDYPNLFPALAAQFASVTGCWNPYVSKGAIFLLLVSMSLWLFSFAEFSWSWFLTAILTVFGISHLPFAGEMDAYIAFYMMMAMLLLGRSIRTGSVLDLVSVFCCLFMMLHLKNEGTLAALAGSLVAIAACRSRIVQSIRADWRSMVVPLLCFLPFIIWRLRMQQWGLMSDRDILSMRALHATAQRLADGRSLGLILEYEQKAIIPCLTFLWMFALVSIARARLQLAALPAFFAGLIYWGGLTMVYLLTPNDLEWHLGSSADRTILCVQFAFWAGIIILIQCLEEDLPSGDQYHLPSS